MVSFRGQKKLGPRPDWSPLGFNSKFPTSIPTPFICEVPPGFQTPPDDSILSSTLSPGSLYS